MSNNVASSLFIGSSLTRYRGFYQQLLSGISSIQELGNRLISEAEAAQALRQSDKVEEMGLMLSNLSVKEYKLLGQYYLGWCAYRKGEDVRSIFEQTIEESTTYKVKGLIALAAVEARNGDFDSELEHYTEAAKYADSYTNLVTSLKAIAVIKAKEGYHRQALKDLESIGSLAYRASSKTCFDYLNSLAVELGEAGRKEEARNVIGLVLASAYASAYPEWLETAEKLKPANRSFVVPNPSPARMGKLLTMPVIEPAEPVKQDKPAGIINLQQWKMTMAKDKDQEGRYSPNMAEDKMLREVVNLFTADDMDRQTKFQMLESIAVIVAKKRAKKHDKNDDKDKDKN